MVLGDRAASFFQTRSWAIANNPPLHRKETKLTGCEVEKPPPSRRKQLTVCELEVQVEVVELEEPLIKHIITPLINQTRYPPTLWSLEASFQSLKKKKQSKIRNWSPARPPATQGPGLPPRSFLTNFFVSCFNASWGRLSDPFLVVFASQTKTQNSVKDGSQLSSHFRSSLGTDVS